LGFPAYRVFSSAIVGGQVSIAIGAAIAEKINQTGNHVWCFVGDMTSETGIFQTSTRYAEVNDLPVTFVIEDNGISVLTDTREVWGCTSLRYEERESKKVRSFKYRSKYPHAGAGKRIQF
jgi:TPP-dependent pyruvate/acetoin dehydrogenase alpha subunit